MIYSTKSRVMIKFKLYLTTPKEKNSLLVAKGYYKGRCIVITTKVNIPTKYWTQKTQRLSDNAEFKDRDIVLKKLNIFQTKLNQTNRFFIDKEEELTSRNFKSVFNEESNVTYYRTRSFTEYLDRFIDTRQKSGAYKKESIKVYKTLKVHITAFNRNRDILFNDMTIDFIQEFINYLQNKNEMVSKNRTVNS